MVLAHEEREVRVAALAPEHGFVLHPARPAFVFHCSPTVSAQPHNTNPNPQSTNHKPKPKTTNHKPQIANREQQTTNHKPGIIQRWQGRVHTRKILGIGMAVGVRERDVSWLFLSCATREPQGQAAATGAACAASCGGLQARANVRQKRMR